MGIISSIARNLSLKKKQEQNVEKVQWAKFTYVGRETRAITKIFKNTNVKVALSTSNTIEKLLATRHLRTKCKYKNCGIYQIACPTCNVKYIGQTERPFKIRFQGHIRDFRYGNGKSRFAQHPLENTHSIGPMDSITNKVWMMDTFERFYTFSETKLNNQINDKLTIKLNIIFDTIVQRDPHRGLSTAYNPQSAALGSVLQDLHLCLHGKDSPIERHQTSTTSQANTRTISATLHYR